MQAYRDHFRPSRWRQEPEGSIGVFVLCAETEEEANRLALSRDLSRLRLEQGRLGPVPSIEEALAHDYTPQERARIAYNRRRQVVGTPAQVKEQLLALGQLYGVDEFVVVSICYDFAARLNPTSCWPRRSGFSRARPPPRSEAAPASSAARRLRRSRM